MSLKSDNMLLFGSETFIMANGYITSLKRGNVFGKHRYSILKKTLLILCAVLFYFK